MCDYHFDYILKEKEQKREVFYEKLYYNAFYRLLKLEKMIYGEYYAYSFTADYLRWFKTYKEKYFACLEQIESCLK